MPFAVQNLLAALWASQPVPHKGLAAGRAHAPVPARLEHHVCPSLPAHHAIHILDVELSPRCSSTVGALAPIGVHVTL